uniref:Uncharacterized protein n=1 Tax=Cacopsylla melanoneura TaxID=428564 RepID=A0A8D8LHL6_9HEMI
MESIMAMRDQLVFNLRVFLSDSMSHWYSWYILITLSVVFVFHLEHNFQVEEQLLRYQERLRTTNLLEEYLFYIILISPIGSWLGMRYYQQAVREPMWFRAALYLSILLQAYLYIIIFTDTAEWVDLQNNHAKSQL